MKNNTSAVFAIQLQLFCEKSKLFALCFRQNAMIVLIILCYIKIANEGFDNCATIFNISTIVIKVISGNNVKLVPVLRNDFIFTPIVVMPR